MNDEPVPVQSSDSRGQGMLNGGASVPPDHTSIQQIWERGAVGKFALLTIGILLISLWFFLLRIIIEDMYPSETGTIGVSYKVHIGFIIVSICCLLYLRPWNGVDQQKKWIKFAIVLFIITCVDAIFIWVSQHPCFHCVHRYKHIFSEGFTEAITDFRGHNWFHVLMQDNPAKSVCRDCSRNLFRWLERFGLFTYCFTDEGTDESWISNETVTDRTELKLWYNEFAKGARKSMFPAALQYYVESILTEGAITKERFNTIAQEVLCHPGSRMGGPDAAQFLETLKTPMFTGEQEWNTSSKEVLDLITKTIRGETMEKLSGSTCIMVRFAGAINEDVAVETRLISPFDVGPRVDETKMNSLYGAHVAPALAMPSTDEDLDKNGFLAKNLEAILTLYTRFHFDQEPIYMDSREEYLLFARWELGHTIQEEWYHPQWLLALDPANAVKLLATQKRSLAQRLILSDSLSDETLVDRMLYGTGSAFVTRVKLPNDDDYHYTYTHPAGPDYYKTNNESEFFLYNHVKSRKPALKDFKRMIMLNWPKAAKCRRKGLLGLFGRRKKRSQICSEENVDVEEYRSRIVEIDLSHFAAFAVREPYFAAPGAILYVDVQNMRPIMIWLAGEGRPVFPGPNDEWEFAKFAFRSAVRNSLAASHVMEYHLSWAHAVATASRQTLPSNHTMRFFLKPYVYGSHSVNWAAYQMLVRKDSILTHASGLTSEGLANDLGHLHKHLNFSRTFPEFLEEKGLPKHLTTDIPLFSQGLRLWDVHWKYVKSFVEVAYPDDESIQNDHSLNRFWHHINTFGRHTDPCVCDMSSDRFFDDRNEWPAFEDEKTCLQLLNFSDFQTAHNEVTRRKEWCSTDISGRERLFGEFLKELKADRSGHTSSLLYDTHYLRSDMGLPALKTRNDLVRFITTFVFQVTAGHGIFGDNMPYMSDPAYCAVRQRPPGYTKVTDGIPLTDVATYIFGTSVAALTTIRSIPLLSDWIPLYEQMSIDKPELKPLLVTIHNEYKKDLLRLSNDFLEENLKLQNKNRMWNVLNPATQMSSVSV